jgi:hypothetical protein
VLRVALSGNHLRVITAPAVKRKPLLDALKQAGLERSTIQQTTPDLEDVFLTLARE